jgi:hypothetical protein
MEFDSNLITFLLLFNYLLYYSKIFFSLIYVIQPTYVSNNYIFILQIRTTVNPLKWPVSPINHVMKSKEPISSPNEVASPLLFYPRSKLFDAVPPVPTAIFCCPAGFNMINDDQSETESQSQQPTPECTEKHISSVSKRTLDPDVAEFIPMGRTNGPITINTNAGLENNQKNYGK